MLIEELSARFDRERDDVQWLVDSPSDLYRTRVVRGRDPHRSRKLLIPDWPLMHMQRWALHRYLAKLPVHEAATAYEPGCSTTRNARAHARGHSLLRLDFAEFFASIERKDLVIHFHIHSSCFPQGWTQRDSEDLANLACCLGRLPIGAPTSPRLANSVCFLMDQRIAAVCDPYEVEYTRYADDLYFSSKSPAFDWYFFGDEIAHVIASLPYPRHLRFNPRKTRHASRGTRRRVTGIILTPQGTLSLGRQKKRHLRSLIHRLETLDRKQRHHLSGWLAYASAVEPEFLDRLRRKFGEERISLARRCVPEPLKEPNDEREASAMSDQSSGSAWHQQPWARKVSELVAKRRFTQAFRVIESVIDEELPLFWGTEFAEHNRRVAWLYGIHLLRQMGRRSAALAWTCLECEVHPENRSAQVLKSQLMDELRLGQPTATPEPTLAIDVQWPGVAGMGPLKALLERDVVRPLRNPALHREYGLRPPNGIVFHGPPGCGKTYLAKALGKVIGFRFLEIKPSDLGSIYVHGSQKLVAQAFDAARKDGPTMLFFDELDALIPSRSQDQLHHHYRETVNEFLVRLNNCSQDGILVVAATNMLSLIDPAALRAGRLEHHFYIGPPDFEGRLDAVRQHMADRKRDADIDWLNIAAASEGLTFADVELVVNQAARRALAEKRPISTMDLLEAVQERRQST